MEKLKIETPLGTLYAAPSGDQLFYPGIVVGLERDGHCAEFVLVEVGNTSDESYNGLNVHVWNLDKNVWNSDPCFEIGAMPEQVNEMIKGVEE